MNAATIPLRYAPTSSPRLSTAAIAVSVATHIGIIALLWSLQVVAVPPQLTTLMAQIIAPAAPTPNTAPPPSTTAPKPPPRPAAKPPKPAATTQRLALPSTSESSAPPVAAPDQTPPAPGAGQTGAGQTGAGAATNATPNAATSAASNDGTASVSQPRFDADYLRNPAPAYPPLSRRLGEQGRVVLRVLVAPSGRPTQIEVKTSSGLPRLDQSAQDAVARWQFVPARRGEQAVDAWVLVPIVFNLRS